MSLLNLVHKNVIIKFSDAAKTKFSPGASYAFRLTGVDAMGFLHIQDLKPRGDNGHEAAAEPYWINKDLVREIHELDLAKVTETLHYTGQATKIEAKLSGTSAVQAPPKLGKGKISAKQKASVADEDVRVPDGKPGLKK